MKRTYFFCTILFAFWCITVNAQKQPHTFKVIPLGIYGGSDESNLSCYMLGINNTDKYVCLDAGTLHAGIDIAIKEKVFTTTTSTVLRNNIQGYLISHPHLDHLAGLIINSPDDTTKHIYGLPFCLDVIADKYFSWKSWANFGDAGEQPLLKKYHYNRLLEGSEIALANTNMFVTAFEISHANPYQSTAFLVRTDSAYVLYLGDTGADEIERSTKLQELWNRVTPLIKTKQLKGIFIETSFPDEQPNEKLFGHLTPSLLMKELKNLSLLCGEDNLQNVPIIITHIKPSGNNEIIIKNELKQENTQDLQLVFPKQGKQFLL